MIKNPQGGPVPPKTLNEAGIMAVAYRFVIQIIKIKKVRKSFKNLKVNNLNILL